MEVWLILSSRAEDLLPLKKYLTSLPDGKAFAIKLLWAVVKPVSTSIIHRTSSQPVRDLNFYSMLAHSSSMICLLLTDALTLACRNRRCMVMVSSPDREWSTAESPLLSLKTSQYLEDHFQRPSLRKSVKLWTKLLLWEHPALDLTIQEVLVFKRVLILSLDTLKSSRETSTALEWSLSFQL